MTMRALVTGAAGFLGSHLCDRLLREGHEVIGMDNLITGSPDNTAHLIGDASFRFVRHDVRHDARARTLHWSVGAESEDSCRITPLSFS